MENFSRIVPAMPWPTRWVEFLEFTLVIERAVRVIRMRFGITTSLLVSVSLPFFKSLCISAEPHHAGREPTVLVRIKRS